LLKLEKFTVFCVDFFREPITTLAKFSEYFFRSSKDVKINHTGKLGETFVRIDLKQPSRLVVGPNWDSINFVGSAIFSAT
jgi:hypothetical protein